MPNFHRIRIDINIVREDGEEVYTSELHHSYVTCEELAEAIAELGSGLQYSALEFLAQQMAVLPLSKTGKFVNN